METKVPATTNLLAIASHHDDIELMAMDGVLKAYGSKKYAFYACVVGDASNCNKIGKYADCSDKELMETRNQEQARASQIGEYEDLILLKKSQSDIEDLDNTTIVKELQKIILDINPDVVYTHNIFDRNLSHVRLALKVIEAILALPEESRPRLLYGCEIFRSLDWLPERYRVNFDISDNKEIQSRLIGVYDTMAEHSQNFAKAVVGRKLSNATFLGDKMGEEDKMLWFGLNLTPVISKGIPLKDYVIKILNDYNKEMLDNIDSKNS